MPADLQSIADPRLILVSWAAGLAVVGGVITYTRIVGPGFTWLVAGTAVLIGVAGALADGAWWARIAMALLVVALVAGRRPKVASPSLALAGVALLTEGALLGGPLAAATATVALGGVTGEMMLGHWYLVDPRLPRAALRNLAWVGIGGLVAETALHLSLGIGFGGGALSFWVLLVGSVVMMLAVIGALRQPAYSGVMAATGLSYLALLTTLGAVFVGRALAAGLGPFEFG